MIAKRTSGSVYHRRRPRQISARQLKGLESYRRHARRYESNPFVRAVLLSIRIPAEVLKLLVRN